MSTANIPVKNNDASQPLATGNGDTDLKNKTEQSSPTVVDKATEVHSSVMDKAKDVAASVAHAVGDAGAMVEEKANEATAAVGRGMNSLAGTIRHNMPCEGVLGTASSSAAASLERGGRYLQHEGIGGMAKEFTNVIRRNPVPAVLVSVGIGFLVAKVTVWSFGHGK